MGLDQWINVQYYGESGEHLETSFYYRKVNFLRKWFEDNGMDIESDCDIYYIDIMDIIALKDDCETVLENPSYAKYVLPTTSGLFFGSTDYDEYYFNDVKKVLNDINEILDLYEHEEVIDIHYTDWW